MSSNFWWILEYNYHNLYSHPSLNGVKIIKLLVIILNRKYQYSNPVHDPKTGEAILKRHRQTGPVIQPCAESLLHHPGIPCTKSSRTKLVTVDMPYMCPPCENNELQRREREQFEIMRQYAISDSTFGEESLRRYVGGAWTHHQLQDGIEAEVQRRVGTGWVSCAGWEEWKGS